MKIIITEIDEIARQGIELFYGIRVKKGKVVSETEANYISLYCIANNFKVEFAEVE